jgi:hypothetical protein
VSTEVPVTVLVAVADEVDGDAAEGVGEELDDEVLPLVPGAMAAGTDTRLVALAVLKPSRSTNPVMVPAIARMTRRTTAPTLELVGLGVDVTTVDAEAAQGAGNSDLHGRWAAEIDVMLVEIRQLRKHLR